jgi:prolipoprotein diacylglyceryl transferase
VPSSVVNTLIASIPSPGRSSIEIGPLTLRMYGLCIALGVIAAVMIGGKRWTARGGDPATFSNLAMWAVPAGVLGARIYHVATDFQKYDNDLVRALKIWKGGLSIWGAIGGGVIGIWLYSWHHRHRLRDLLDTVAPGLAAAQAVGRLGNWFNQELFGKPTDLPWGLEIDPEHRPAGYAANETFHPTFLYELLWNLLVVALLVRAERRFKLKGGQVFALYGALYCFGRFWIELIRIDFATEVAGLRINVWTSIVLFGVSVAALVLIGRRERARALASDEDAEDTDSAGGAATDPDTDTDSDADRASDTDGGEAATDPAPAGRPASQPSE